MARRRAARDERDHRRKKEFFPAFARGRGGRIHAHQILLVANIAPLPSPPVLSSFKRSGCGIEKAVGSVFVFFPYRRRNFEKVRRFYNVHIHVAIFRLFVISWKIKIIFLRPIVLDRSFMVKLQLLDDEASIERVFIYVYIYTFFSSLSRTRYVYIRRISARDNRARVSALRVAKHVAHFSRFDR